MPGKGFLSQYEGTTRVDLGGGYWVDVKKVLSYAESEAAEKAGLVFRTSDPSDSEDGKTHTKVEIEPAAKLFEQVLASVVAWNLDDETGKIWSTDYNRALEEGMAQQYGRLGDRWKMPLRKNLERIPKPVYDIVAQVVGKANRPPTKEDEATFPERSELGAPVGEVGAPDNHQVLSGDGLLAEVGASGGSPTTA